MFLGTSLDVKLITVDQLSLKEHLVGVSPIVVPLALGTCAGSVILECGLDLVYPVIDSNDGCKVGLCIAERYSLPACVLDYFDTARGPGSVHQWSEIVRRAHEMVSSSPVHASVVTI